MMQNPILFVDGVLKCSTVAWTLGHLVVVVVGLQAQVLQPIQAFRRLCTMKAVAALVLAAGSSVSLLGCGSASCSHDMCTPEGQKAYLADVVKTTLDAGTDVAKMCDLAKTAAACGVARGGCEDATAGEKAAVTTHQAVLDADC